ncbi:MAG: hypothetical protein II637_02290, partial [Bacteroidales bacterium]|nr:hypothetical protein [Bacteroidales bacterium]
MKLLRLALIALAISACTKTVSTGDLTVIPADDSMEFNLEAAIASTPLTEGATDFGTIRIAGEEVRFITVGYSKRSISDGFGKGTCYIYKGEAVSGPAISRELRLSVYKDFPSTVLVDAVYHNLSGEDLSVDGWSMCDLSAEPPLIHQQHNCNADNEPDGAAYMIVSADHQRERIIDS